ncbi:MAG: hypothetical protein MUE60_10095 [Candidatus Eisenbacteria bacterium]|nr:hypothetical protein [Candidatus Eisenbacteria bacterium]
MSGAAAAAAAAKQRRDKEEEMTRYTDSEVEGSWEFKILRSNTGAFGKAVVLRRVCDEEARAGWTLIEKFDNERLRFKRPTSARAGDSELPFDPYRSYWGIGTGAFVALMIGGVFAVIFAVVAIVNTAR